MNTMTTITSDAPRLPPRAAEVFEAIQAFEGATIEQIMAVCDLKVDAARKQVGYLGRRGLIASRRDRDPERLKSDGSPVSFARYYVADDSERQAAKPRGEAAQTLNDQIAALKSEIAELRAFKAAALERYPDLAVPEVVMRARKIVAKHLSDPANMTRLNNGLMDSSPIMLATIAALEGEE